MARVKGIYAADTTAKRHIKVDTAAQNTNKATPNSDGIVTKPGLLIPVTTHQGHIMHCTKDSRDFATPSILTSYPAKSLPEPMSFTASHPCHVILPVDGSNSPAGNLCCRNLAVDTSLPGRG